MLCSQQEQLKHKRKEKKIKFATEKAKTSKCEKGGDEEKSKGGGGKRE